METENIKKIYALLNEIPVTKENEKNIEEIKECLLNGDFIQALEKIQNLRLEEKKQEEPQMQEKEAQETTGMYPKELSNPQLEYIYMGLLLNNPKFIVKYYFLYENCFFEEEDILNLYKSVLFTDGGNYTQEIAKKGFNFAKDTEESYALKKQLKEKMAKEEYSMEAIYTELKKLFILRKNYLEMPIKEIQDAIVDITNYELYHEMSEEEVESAIRQVNDTKKFKRAILNQNLSEFLRTGENNLTNGLAMPFPILSNVFKGIRKGETMAFAMPSNSGKSRLTIYLAAYTAFVHKKKVLIISNEMSEEKMRLCLMTTILNHPEIQKKHGQMLHKTEGELLEFQFRPDSKYKVKVDKEGFVVKEAKESQIEFAKKLTEISSEYNRTIAVMDWVNKEMNNSIYFINITDHTNDELRKVIMNYYYKEKIEYVFYDTLKTDTANIGIAEELKKTATILSNLAQNFNLFICSTLQLTESTTSPINLDVNDLAVSRTVKEVLDTLCLMKQIQPDSLQDYAYTIQEIDTQSYDLEKEKNPDIRYYACVVDKNRAGAKPKLVFRINLAYNAWEELGYLKLKSKTERKEK